MSKCARDARNYQLIPTTVWRRPSCLRIRGVVHIRIPHGARKAALPISEMDAQNLMSNPPAADDPQGEIRRLPPADICQSFAARCGVCEHTRLRESDIRLKRVRN